MKNKIIDQIIRKNNNGTKCIMSKNLGTICVLHPLLITKTNFVKLHGPNLLINPLQVWRVMYHVRFFTNFFFKKLSE